MTLASLHRTLDQELAAILRGASLECPVCGEFLLHRADGIGCPQCGQIDILTTRSLYSLTART